MVIKNLFILLYFFIKKNIYYLSYIIGLWENIQGNWKWYETIYTNKTSRKHIKLVQRIRINRERIIKYSYPLIVVVLIISIIIIIQCTLIVPPTL